jgi:hypothetical protein
LSGDRALGIVTQAHGTNAPRLFAETLAKFGLMSPPNSVAETARFKSPEPVSMLVGRFRRGGQILEIRQDGETLLAQVHDDNFASGASFPLKIVTPRLIAGNGDIGNNEIEGLFYLEYLEKNDPKGFNYIRLRDQVFKAS